MKIKSFFFFFFVRMKDHNYNCLGAPFDAVMEIAEAAFAADEDSNLPSAVLRERQKALTDTLDRVHAYRAHGIRNDLVHTVFEKRLELIKKARTVQALKEIQSEPKPRYDGGQFITGPACVPEEEMICWSLASLQAPLVSEALKRYMDLFYQVFGFYPWEAENDVAEVQL